MASLFSASTTDPEIVVCAAPRFAESNSNTNRPFKNAFFVFIFFCFQLFINTVGPTEAARYFMIHASKLVYF